MIVRRDMATRRAVIFLRYRRIVLFVLLGASIAFFGLSVVSVDAKPKAGTYKDNGVIIKKNADGSIETYDTSDGPVYSTSGTGSSARGGSTKKHSSSTRNIGGVHVKKNADGSIETSDTVDSVDTIDTGSGASAPGCAPANSGSAKPYTKNMGGVTVRKNSDGSIETFDSGGSAPRSTRATRSGSGVKSSGKKAAVRQAVGRRSAARRRQPSGGGGGGVHVQKNADGSIETWD